MGCNYCNWYKALGSVIPMLGLSSCHWCEEWGWWIMDEGRFSGIAMKKMKSGLCIGFWARGVRIEPSITIFWIKMQACLFACWKDKSRSKKVECCLFQLLVCKKWVRLSFPSHFNAKLVQTERHRSPVIRLSNHCQPYHRDSVPYNLDAAARHTCPAPNDIRSLLNKLHNTAAIFD